MQQRPASLKPREDSKEASAASRPRPRVIRQIPGSRSPFNFINPRFEIDLLYSMHSVSGSAQLLGIIWTGYLKGKIRVVLGQDHRKGNAGGYITLELPVSKARSIVCPGRAWSVIATIRR